MKVIRLLKDMAVIEDCWNYRVDINSLKNGSYREFEARVCSLREDILNKNCFKIQKFSYNNVQSHEEELKCLLEENKLLRNEIDSKQEELAKQKSQYETFKQGKIYEVVYIIVTSVCYILALLVVNNNFVMLRPN